MRTGELQTLYNYQYVTYDDKGERIKIVCRKCNDTIAEIMDVGKGRHPATGAVIVRKAFRSLPNYTKVQLELSNGVEMFSAMCKKCSKTLAMDELKALYLSEIQAIEYDGVIHNRETQTYPIVAELLGLTVSRRIS